MDCDPLNQYLSKMNSPIHFIPNIKYNERGYLGKWAVLKNGLHLIDFIGVLENRNEIFLDNLFPDKQTVFAEWFTGEIILTQGKLLALKSKYSLAVYEKDLHLDFINGRLIRTYIVENTRDSISGFFDNLQYGGGKVRLMWK